MDKPIKTTVIGLGLIGGSMAIDIRRTEIAGEINAIDKDPENLKRAMELGIIDNEENSIATSDLIILAIPVDSLTQLLPDLLWKLKSSAVVIDTGSTKSTICKAVADHPKRSQFVAAHPIAGTENSGVNAAFSGLFRDKINIICEKEKSSKEALAMAKKLFDELGMKVSYMQPEEHDKHVAYVSHLSHVSSFLLGQTVLDIEKDEKNIFMLAGSGFASTVRLAKSSPDMWAPIFEQNMEHLSMALQEYIIHLQRFQYHLMKKNKSELLRTLKEANTIREVLTGFDKDEISKMKINKNEKLVEEKN